VGREKVKVNFGTSLLPDIVLTVQHIGSVSLQYCSTLYKDQWCTSTWSYKDFLCNYLPISYIVEDYAVDSQPDLPERCIKFGHLATLTSAALRWMSSLWFQCAAFAAYRSRNRDL